MKVVLPIGCLLAAAAMAQQPPRAEPVPNTAVIPPGPAAVEQAVSRSGQFRVSGADGMLRGTVAMLAEEAKSELMELTGEKDDWKVPVSIILHGQQGDPMRPRSVAMKLWFGDNRFELRIDVHLSRGIDMEPFKHTTTAALLYERALRTMPADKKPETALSIPPWLVEGLREATAWKQQRSDRRLYEDIFKHGGLFKLDEVFATNESQFADLDGGMRMAFRVSAGALVMALLEQPQGRDGFRSFLTDAPVFKGEMPMLLRRHFPDLNLSESSLAKWWRLQLATMTTPNLTEVLSIDETEAALDEALQLNFRAQDGSSERRALDTWPQLAELKDAERLETVRLAQDALVRLSYRCFPSYRPIIAEYQIALSNIARNKTQMTASQLDGLLQTRTTMLAKSGRGRDYLDWFEITRARETSGMFEDYLRLKERLRANPHDRQDNLTKYLDRLNTIFERASEAPPVNPLYDLPGEYPLDVPIDLPPGLLQR